MNGANHKRSGFSTFPFNIFGHGWERFTPALSELPIKGDIVLSNLESKSQVAKKWPLDRKDERI